MPNKPDRLYWDTSVFIEYFNADPASRWFAPVRSLLASAKEGRFQICTSVLAIIEAAFVKPLEYPGKTFLGGHEDDLDRMWLDHPTILTVRCDDTIARTARAMNRWAIQNQIKRIQPDDLAHIATAMYLKVGAIHTMDQWWFPYERFAQISIGYPEAPAAPPELFPTLLP